MASGAANIAAPNNGWHQWFRSLTRLSKGLLLYVCPADECNANKGMLPVRARVRAALR